MSNPVKLMIDGGIVPENVLKQLVRWKLLPEDYASRVGPSEVEFDSPEEFVHALQNAIDEESATIRETNLDQVDRAIDVDLFFGPGAELQQVRGSFDLLNRVILSSDVDAENLEQVGYSKDDHSYHRRNVVRIEPRYEGDQHTHWVCYLEDTNVQEAEAAPSAN
jgi:hypothetical protein